MSNAPAWLKKPRTDLQEGLALSEALPLRGALYEVAPLTLLDIALFSERHGSIFQLDLNDTEHASTLLWLTLRKLDPDLPATERAAGRYRLTREAVQEAFTLYDLINDTEVIAFVRRIVEMTGLYQEVEGAAPHGDDRGAAPHGDDPKNDQEPARRRRSASSGS